MIAFPIVSLYDTDTAQTIEFARADGAATSIVILDDGWTPAVARYVRDGRVTWSEVVEEMDCMTNTSTRDAALNLIETINAMIHRAKRYLDGDNAAAVLLQVRSQFSDANANVAARVLGPPDDGAVIQLTPDFQTSPPGAIRFRLRFKRNGAWSVGNVLQYTATLSSSPWALFPGTISLPASAVLPTPVSVKFERTPAADGVEVRRMYVGVGVLGAASSPAEEWSVGNSAVADKVTIAASWSAYQNTVMLFTGTSNSAASTLKLLQAGTYAVFLTYRVRQANTVHSVQLSFDEVNVTTDPVLLFGADTNPDLAYVGTVTLPNQNTAITFRSAVGHSSGFELGEAIFVRLSNTASIVELQSWTWYENHNLFIDNDYNMNMQRVRHVYSSSVFSLLSVFDSLDIVMTSTTAKIAVAGVANGKYTLVTTSGQRITSLLATVFYRPIRTVIQ